MMDVGMTAAALGRSAHATSTLVRAAAGKALGDDLMAWKRAKLMVDALVI
jgi:hypothetical protein